MSTISARMLAVFTALFAAISIMAAISLYSNAQMTEALRTVYVDRVVPLRDLKAISDAYAVDIVDTTHKTRAGRLTEAEALANIARASAVSNERWTAYLATSMDDREKSLAKDASQRFTAAHAATDTLVAILKAGDGPRLVDFAEKRMYPAIDPLTGAIDELIKVQVDEAEKANNAAVATNRIVWGVIVASIVAGIVLVVLGGLFVRRRRRLSDRRPHGDDEAPRRSRPRRRDPSHRQRRRSRHHGPGGPRLSRRHGRCRPDACGSGGRRSRQTGPRRTDRWPA